MDDHTITRPARARPERRRRRHEPEPRQVPRQIADDAARTVARATDEPAARMEGGGSSGRGPGDDDGGGRRPDRDGDDARRLLIALGILAGAGVISARLLAKGGRPPHP